MRKQQQQKRFINKRNDLGCCRVKNHTLLKRVITRKYDVVICVLLLSKTMESKREIAALRWRLRREKKSTETINTKQDRPWVLSRKESNQKDRTEWIWKAKRLKHIPGLKMLLAKQHPSLDF